MVLELSTTQSYSQALKVQGESTEAVFAMCIARKVFSDEDSVCMLQTFSQAVGECFRDLETLREHGAGGGQLVHTPYQVTYYTAASVCT